jgi:16S rRNA (cytosine967-C5)-methyltransferase
VLTRYARKDVKKPVKYLVWATLYQVTFMKKAAHHVVKESVDYAKFEHGIHIAGFVNAVLRKFLRDMKNEEIHLPGVSNTDVSPPQQEIAVVHSMPQWLIQRWTKRFGPANTEKLCRTLNTPPEFALRINNNIISRVEAIRRLKNLGIEVKPGRFLESALHVSILAPLIKNNLLSDKMITIQDEVSQLAVYALQLEPGSVILDACSGLGTKTSHIIDLARGILLIASDNSMARLIHTDRRASLVQGDVVNAPFKDETFDTILLDAPCSSLGIIRKHPEIKWRRHEKDIIDFGNQQYAMLKSIWDKLKVGGHLVYSVCSFEPDETLNIIERFKGDRKFALENPLPFLFNKEYFLSLPFETGMDGFFIARLRKL